MTLYVSGVTWVTCNIHTHTLYFTLSHGALWLVRTAALTAVTGYYSNSFLAGTYTRRIREPMKFSVCKKSPVSALFNRHDLNKENKRSAAEWTTVYRTGTKYLETGKNNEVSFFNKTHFIIIKKLMWYKKNKSFQEVRNSWLFSFNSMSWSVNCFNPY